MLKERIITILSPVQLLISRSSSDPQGRFPLGGIFRVERHFSLENVMGIRSSLLLCLNFRRKFPLGGACVIRKR